MHADCIFCKIGRKKAPAKIVMETDNVVVFEDAHPKVPIHLLIAPKKHYDDVLGVTDKVWAEIRHVADKLATKKKLMGFRLVTNAGSSAIINHMHVHFLGGVSKEREV